MKSPLHNSIPVSLGRSPTKKRVIIHFGLLVLWIVLGSIVRFSHLDGKTVWSDEWATIVFSLGHSFRSVPLDRVISLSSILEPLRIDSSGASDVISHLMRESTHPPLYFVISNWWLRLFSNNGDLVSLWLARSLGAAFGVLAIPAMFGLGWSSFNSLLAGQIAAGLMAVSPYGIYLAQETRHYTLVILWVIASLACWIITIHQRSQNRIPRRSLILGWIVVNSLGIATHYFFGLNLLVQVLVLLTLWWRDVRGRSKTKLAAWLTPFWRRIGIAVLGTMAGCSVWVLSWQYFPDDRLTEWTQQDPSWNLELLFPIGRLLGWIITMFVLPPAEGVSIWVTIAFLVVLLPVVLWFVRAALPYLTISNPVEKAIALFIAISLMLNLVFAYILGRDLTIAARFQYFYFPVILILGAAILCRKWQRSKAWVVAVLISGCLGGIVVTNNYGFQKSDRPDLVVPTIAEVNRLNKNIPIVIATVHKTHEQTGEMMGLAWEWQQKYSTDNGTNPQFLLLHVEENYRTVTSNLYRFLEQSSRPLDLWLVNFSASTILKYHSLASQGCVVSPDYQLKVSGYRFNHYYCQKKPLDARENYY